VILGASRPEQLKENLKALEVLPKLTPDVLKKIEEIVGTVPKPEVSGRSSCRYDVMADRVA
jgi:aryl-alcohol dehydrogenase-like predicted oxidoreductase